MATDKELNDKAREEARLALDLLKPLQAERVAQRKQTEAEIDRLEDELDTLRDKESNIQESLLFLEHVGNFFDLYDKFGVDGEREEEHIHALRSEVSGILEALNK